MSDQLVTREYLRDHPNHIFVFGDNLLRIGTSGAAELRDESNTYGFITKKSPGWNDEDFYKPEEYLYVYHDEFRKLSAFIDDNSDKTFLISKIGAGLANRFGIFEMVIKNRIKVSLSCRPNVKFLW